MSASASSALAPWAMVCGLPYHAAMTSCMFVRQGVACTCTRGHDRDSTCHTGLALNLQQDLKAADERNLLVHNRSPGKYGPHIKAGAQA